MRNLIVTEFHAALQGDPQAQILDVRTPGEHAQGHIQGALLCDIYEADFMQKAQALLDPARPVYVYCRSGARSSSAASMLGAQGYNVTNLIGGYTAWEVKGY